MFNVSTHTHTNERPANRLQMHSSTVQILTFLWWFKCSVLKGATEDKSKHLQTSFTAFPAAMTTKYVDSREACAASI